jgi:hypothetical protein
MIEAVSRPILNDGFALITAKLFQFQFQFQFQLGLITIEVQLVNTTPALLVNRMPRFPSAAITGII